MNWLSLQLRLEYTECLQRQQRNPSEKPTSVSYPETLCGSVLNVLLLTEGR
jgi:hypothetical protein